MLTNMSFTEEKLTTESEARFNHLVRDITQAGFMAKSEARRRLEEIVQLELKAQKQLIKDELGKLKSTTSVCSAHQERRPECETCNPLRLYNQALDQAINLIDKI